MGEGTRRGTIDRTHPIPYYRNTNPVLAAGAVRVIEQIHSEGSI